MLYDACHHYSPCHLLSQCSMAPVCTVLHEPFRLNAPWPHSSQCPLTPVITMFHGPCHHSAPSVCPHCSMAPVITMLHALVITGLHNSCLVPGVTPGSSGLFRGNLLSYPGFPWRPFFPKCPSLRPEPRNPPQIASFIGAPHDHFTVLNCVGQLPFLCFNVPVSRALLFIIKNLFKCFHKLKSYSPSKGKFCPLTQCGNSCVQV